MAAISVGRTGTAVCGSANKLPNPQIVARLMTIQLGGAMSLDDNTLAQPYPGNAPLPNAALHQLIARYAPSIHFHPGEVFFPSSVEWYLARAQLTERATAIVVQHPAAADLPAIEPDPANPEQYWLGLDPAGADPSAAPDAMPSDDWRRGALDGAKAYVRAVHDTAHGHTDLQFWLFYPFDGPGVARVRLFEAGGLRGSDDVSLWPIGIHQADWEMSAIRIDHATQAPSAVFLSQHYGGDSYIGVDALSALEREDDGRFRFYAARNSHATYAAPQIRPLYYKQISLGVAAVEFALIDEIAGGGLMIAMNQPERHMLVSTSWHDSEVPEPAWLRFAFRWGRYDPEGGVLRSDLVRQLTRLLDRRATALAGLIIIITMGLFALAEAFLPRLLKGKLGQGIVGKNQDTSGPVGPSHQPAKWNGAYAFPGPPPPTQWRSDGAAWQRNLANLADAIARPLVWLASSIARLIAAAFGSDG